jgi:hypothetical protein
MSTYYYTLFIIFTVIVTMMILDHNVSEYINLLFKILKVNIERFIWMIRFHPNNFITTYLQNRKYDKIARELEKEIQDEIEMERKSREFNHNSKTIE